MNHSPELKPGIRALTLPHPEAFPGWANQVVQVTSYPATEKVIGGGARVLMRTVCTITLPDGSTHTGAGNPIGWPACALLPLPGDDEAERLFSGRIVTMTVPNPSYKEEA